MLIAHIVTDSHLDTIARHQALYEGKSSYANSYLWIYCNEDSYWFKSCPEKSLVFAYEYEADYVHNWYITFCPAFYDNNIRVPLSKIMDRMNRNPRMRRVMEFYNGWYSEKGNIPGSQAATVFHETMHFTKLVTSPFTRDFAYGPLDIYNLARERNTDLAVYNPDSWKLTAMAIWAQQKWNLFNPPKPGAFTQNDATNATDLASVLNTSSSNPTVDVVYVSAQQIVPEGASPVGKNTPYFVDTNLWEICTPTSAPLAKSTPNKVPRGSIATPTSGVSTSINFGILGFKLRR